MHLKPISIYTAGSSPALDYARHELCEYITDDPGSATHLLLPVPSFDPDGSIKGGGFLEPLLLKFPHLPVIIGGNLTHPALEGCSTLDLLQDPFYVARNAAITAHCALGLILTALPVTLPGERVLVLGFGRIGKCMADLLRNVGANVTVAARKDADRAMAEALGFDSTDLRYLQPVTYRVIVNTIPAPVLDEANCDSNTLLLELASLKGIAGSNVNWARGLPGKCVPETSGKLIAATVRRLIIGKEITL